MVQDQPEALAVVVLLDLFPAVALMALSDCSAISERGVSGPADTSRAGQSRVRVSMSQAWTFPGPGPPHSAPLPHPQPLAQGWAAGPTELGSFVFSSGV